MRCSHLICLFLLLFVNCRTASSPQAEPRSAAAPGDILGHVQGVPIRLQDIPSATQTRLTDLTNEYAQRQYHLLWTGVEEVIAEHLLQREAEKRGVAVERLLHEEVDSKVAAPSDDEIRDLYEANRAIINVPFAKAAPLLQEQWHADRVSQLRRALVDRLREGAEVTYALPPPALPRYPISRGDGPSLGPKTASIIIVEFGDFQCPYSAQAWRLLHRLTELYPNDVQVVFRDYPLQQHPRAAQAAEAAHCAREQQRFWPYHDLLFENTQALTLPDLQRYAAQAELNADMFNSCMASERPRQAVALSAREAQRYGVQGTPALFINGMRLEGVLPLPLMQAIIERELKRLATL